ncbi:acyltransferase family protein [Streptomyces sp. ERV7]|uniref:acyltransferase family protein n=1 Tax=Streptomyces sp. ERV7 TaxID=1322334 RepID=UPI00099FDE22|nr:acyltransferase [Streptomyces sp. ERV7]
MTTTEPTGARPQPGPYGTGEQGTSPYAEQGAAPYAEQGAGAHSAQGTDPRYLTPPAAALRHKPEAAAPARPGRDRYFDLLRALALFRVVLYHLMSWTWLPLAFPSMGVMFALAGNLMGRSLKRPAPQVIRSRMRRLLPPMWLLGAIGVTGMIAQGWGPDADGHPGWWWTHLLFWIVPLSDPPFAADLPGVHGFLDGSWAGNIAEPLWYLRAYLWYVLLSPLILRYLRKVPWTTILAPLVLSAVMTLGSFDLPERIDSTITDFSTFGACWVLGMAHQEGVLSRVPRYIVPAVAPFILGLGLWWAMRNDFGDGNELDGIPLAQALWSFGAVLLLLHFSPSWSEWPPRLRRWDRLITLLNSRAVTVYLWHNVCILAAATMWDQLWNVGSLGESVPWLLDSAWPVLAFTWVLIGLCVLSFGWVEDVAAKRSPRLWPDGKERGRRKR